MSFFCLCTTKGVVGDKLDFKVDTYDATELDLTRALDPKVSRMPLVGLLPPEHAMTCIKVGTRQFLASVPNTPDSDIRPGARVREHFPNVDVFQCKLCGAGFVQG